MNLTNRASGFEAQTLTFEIEGPICKKNNMERRETWGGRKFVGKNDELQAYEDRLFEVIKEAIRKCNWHNTEKAIRFELHYKNQDDIAKVTVTDLGKLATKRSKDLQNLIDSILDVLQSPTGKSRGKRASAIRNDRQITDIRITEE